ncbi:MAG: sensor histidine kinase [Lachnospiraceae bacterium]|nr:sensor histidine kinase [Lachnospiraceae bacterium]
MKRFNSFFSRITIKHKIALFTGCTFLIILVAVFFDGWIVNLFMIDFNDIMEDNAKGGEIINAIDREKDLFDDLIQSSIGSEDKEWIDCKTETDRAIAAIPVNYERLGEKRFALMQALITCYEVYCGERDELLSRDRGSEHYVSDLYGIYSMQDYLSTYAQRFVDLTLKAGNERYRELLPTVFVVPVVAIIVSVILFAALIQLSGMMNRSITEPVLKLANASRRIAANDFHVDDVKAENQDELGELITAFNKMKYATGEYIEALEERREALDKLHIQEMETLEAEKRLDAAKLELLKSQINPHFLFNTLNVIGGMANLEGAEVTEQMIGSLSSLFRYNLKEQEQEALLSQELTVAENYMYLQKQRFGDRVTYETVCKVDADHVCIPTFTLQPLVENSMIHGIAPKVEGGFVRVSIEEQENEMLEIRVSDNGVGIPAEKLEKIRKALAGGEREGDDSVGIGLGNICWRIRSMYAEGRMEVYSTAGEGTTVSIRIPLRREPGRMS